MLKVRLNAGLLLTVLAGAALAQVSTPLPGSLSGRWTYIGRTGTLIDSFSIVFEKNGAAGPIPGKLTWRGYNCGAKDEPIEANWDGSELRFEAVLKADINTQRMNGSHALGPEEKGRRPTLRR
jgi:hypothetical protein